MDDALPAKTHAEYAEICAIALGSPPRRGFLPWLTPLLAKHWLPNATDQTLRRLMAMLSALDPDSFGEIPRGRKRMLAAIASAIENERFQEEFRKAFVAEHSRRRPADSSSGPAPSPRISGRVRLSGRGEARVVERYQHQLEAVEAIDRRLGTRAGRGLMVVLPTGAGKTEVAIDVALSRMRSDQQVRVLWVAHQRQLVEQAAARFAAAARHLPEGFERVARIVHGDASPKSLLAHPETDVVFATVQTLTQPPMHKKRQLLLEFFRRPTIVVIDEAHRAGSASYQSLLEVVDDSEACLGVIGLSATPEPLGERARRAMRDRFPSRGRVIERNLPELIADRILAKPIFHAAVRTGERMELDPEELDRVRRAGDLMPRQLARLNTASRNTLILRTWETERARWGKTLLFAPTIENADALGDLFMAEGVPTQVVHSRAAASRAEAIEWFRELWTPGVLISVGMLTEGVDLPDARTAFLTRPTASHILLNQMIGRVLRGPRAGGEPTARIVYFQDEWTNFEAVLTPRLEDLDGGPGTEGSTPAEIGPMSREVPQDVQDAVELLLGADEDGGEPTLEELVSVEAVELRETLMLGYYRCEDEFGATPVVVLDGQRECLEELARRVIAGSRRVSFEDLFADAPPPVPPRWQLEVFVEQVRRTGDLPAFVDFELTMGPIGTALSLVDAGPITERERWDVIRTDAESARGAGYSLPGYEEAVQRALRDLRRERRRPDGPITPAPSKERLPNEPRRNDAWLQKRMDAVIQLAKARLAGEPELRRLRRIPVEWTRRPIRHAFAYHRIALGGERPGRQIIRVNRVLQAPAKLVPNKLIEFVLWHELMHHLLPGHGHDSRFEELETWFPGWEKWDASLDALEDHWNLAPEE
ncbi:MAG: DEAD/DEAH box helicase [Thermoleophilia bacterium]